MQLGVHVHTVEVLLKYNGAEDGKRKGLGAGCPDPPKLRSNYEESEHELALLGCFQGIFVKVGGIYFTVCWLDL